MNPSDLLAPNNPLGFPAPYWFLVLFKVIGFLLHIIPMSLWYAGILIAMIMYLSKSENGRIFNRRLMSQMPIIVAAGVNLGIVPLLFTQVVYYKVFYPATILMAWFWFSIFILLIFAYYGIYLYASAYKNGGSSLPGWRVIVGWFSAILFILMGFIFTNAFSLMVNLKEWDNIWLKTQVAGAVLGIGHNLNDPTLIPRWLMMFGLAVMTTAAYAIFDANYFATNESDEYKSWVPRFALKLYFIGILIYAIFGSWYIFSSIDSESRVMMLSRPVSLITWMTALSPAVPFFFIFRQYNGIRSFFAFCTALFHLVVLALNSISRQVLQNIELYRYYNMADEKVNLQLSPLIIFLVLFVGLVVSLIYIVSRKNKH